MTKYLVVLEGEEMQVFDTEREAIEYIKGKAENIMLNSDSTNRWLDWLYEMENTGFSCMFTDFPEFILPIDAEDLAGKLLKKLGF